MGDLDNIFLISPCNLYCGYSQKLLTKLRCFRIIWVTTCIITNSSLDLCLSLQSAQDLHCPPIVFDKALFFQPKSTDIFLISSQKHMLC